MATYNSRMKQAIPIKCPLSTQQIIQQATQNYPNSPVYRLLFTPAYFLLGGIFLFNAAGVPKEEDWVLVGRRRGTLITTHMTYQHLVHRLSLKQSTDCTYGASAAMVPMIDRVS